MMMIWKILPAVFAAALAVAPLIAQDGGASNRKQERRERAEAREQDRLKLHKKLLALVEERRFVIELDAYIDRYGRQVPVSPLTNFVAVYDSSGTVQLAFPNLARDRNGLGGVTLDGRVSSYELLSDTPGKGIRLRLRLFGAAVSSADITVDVLPDGFANVSFSNIRGGRFSGRGILRSWEQSRVYKGTPLF
jgi:hypothetical protein